MERKACTTILRKGLDRGFLSPFLFKLYIDEALTEISANEIGCRLGFLRINILAYADDLVLVADNENNLATLYDILNEKMRHLQLAINKVKSKAMIFSQSYRQDETVELEIGDDRFEVVSHYKYLGHILQANMQDNKDAKHRLNSFYSKFNWVFRNFRNTSLDVLTFLFNAYCTPDYGLPLWCLDGLVNRQDFKTFEVAYSNAFKRMVGVPIGTSSHAAAEAAKLLLFKHHFIYIQARFFKRIRKSVNPVIKLLFYDILEGYIFKSLNNHFYSKYDCEIRENDTDALKAQIFWVQHHEERTGRLLQGIAEN